MTMPSDTDSVDELLEERVDGEIQSVFWFRSRDSARYGLVTALRDNGTVGVVQVLLDVDDDVLRVLGDNSMWLPAEQPILDGAIRSLARACNAAGDSVDADDPMRESLLSFDAEEMGAYELSDDYDPTERDGDWKASEGADEMDRVHERLAESPVETADRLIRLEWGGKAPWEGEPQRVMRSPDQIAGNYGVEVGEDDDLVILDVDDVETAPLDEMPDTLRSESPHGGEHRFYHVPGWREHFRERFDDVENPHPSYGEVRSQDGYVVGPGSELTDCKHGCCTEGDPGQYRLDDGAIATVDAETFGDLIEPYRGGEA
jgi:hypothetical protein